MRSFLVAMSSPHRDDPYSFVAPHPHQRVVRALDIRDRLPSFFVGAWRGQMDYRPPVKKQNGVCEIQTSVCAGFGAFALIPSNITEIPILYARIVEHKHRRRHHGRPMGSRALLDPERESRV